MTSCAAFAELWPVRFPRPDETTNRQHAYMTRAFAEQFGEQPLTSVTRKQAFDFGREHPSSVRYLRTMYEDAIRSGVIDTPNPWVNLRVASTLGRTYTEIPTAEEVVALEAAAPARIRGAITVAAFAMSRLGETLGLRWADLDGDTWDLREQIGKDGRRKALKGQARARKVLLPPAASEALRAAPTGSERVWDVTRWEFYRDWWGAREEVGLDCDFHELRHFGANRLVEARADTRDVAYLMGHRDDSLVRRLYARHVDPTNALARIRAIA